ncbi:hypothetical protein I5Q34_09210 [Streptomyces sp. AV19]|uniref:hypothetical protein n=1 Tax=Streptomyces sp. AV19 TaxID=2793068 RepID=UPI0018FE883A|nr:hypothetical protein [Streptomyces sp. AV19]MBH1934463.1 hypothetical protein [Streptomyces sp. AV19]MDG4533255.1 hypothetical protein [Streptomyces sp. AV19]
MSGPLRLVPPDPGTVHELSPVAPHHGAALDDLARDLADVCAAAVHPDEIAAVLEADGLTSEQISGRYGLRDAFELAAELYARVPRGHPEPPPAPDPWQVKPGLVLLRSLVFTLPGLGYALGAPLMSGGRGPGGLPQGTAALVAAALTAWAWNQGLAHRAYLRLASGGRAAAGRCLRTGAPLGGLLATAAALASGGPAGALAFAIGQALYLSAATVLLVLGRERLLLYTLLPVAGGGAAALVTDPPRVLAAGLLLATLAGVLAAASYQCVLAWREKTTPVPVLSPLASLPYSLFGLGCGILTAVAALGEVLRHGSAAAPAGPAVIALTLSMGAAEWLLYRFRSRALAALGRTTTTGGLLAGIARVLGGCLAAYLAALAVLALAAGAVWPDGPAPTAARTAGLLALGAVLWTGLLLQAYGVAWPPALLCLAAGAAEAAALAAGLPSPATVQLAVCAGTTAALVAASTALLGRITAHR